MSITQRLFRLLPILLTLMIILGIAMVVIVVIIPKWQIHEELSAEVETRQEVLAAQNAAAGENENIVLMQHQIDEIQGSIDEAATGFLTDAEVDSTLTRLYGYANVNQVEITRLQAQQQTEAETDVTTYTTLAFRLQITGDASNLTAFLGQIAEASTPAVVIGNVNLDGTEGQSSTLTIDLQLYTSPYASGGALGDLPEILMPTLEPMDDANTIPVLDETITDPALLAVAVTECPGAPPTLFKIGDTVIVDFEDGSSLNVLERARVDQASIPLLNRVYDNTQLQIMGGPVCGEWKGNKLLYWYVDNNGIKGWVGEATAQNRWLCPQSEPECS
ncbi:MAG: type 4a pilus biogenesis protein PilO [Anaerolineae bacterium]|nr:type 4a pilus biogenesis protein PilO [Anaerolineae bacterium]